MYQPQSQIIRSAARDFQYQDDAFEGGNGVLDTYDRSKYQQYLIDQERKYKETNDLYDLQKAEFESLNEGLKGLSGQDQIYYQQAIIEERDRLKQLFKGKNSREFKSPQVQAEIYASKDRLASKLNRSTTSLEQMQAVAQGLKDAPSTKTGEVMKYLNEQMQLPPHMRDTDIVDRVNSDPLFFEAYDYTASILKGLEKGSAELQQETKDLILNYDATYIPEMEEFDPKTQSFKFNPSDNLVDKLLFSDPNKRFYHKMVGMLPAGQAKALVDSGNDGMLLDAVRNQTKEYLKTVKGFEANLKQTGKTVKSWRHYRPTSADQKQQSQQQEVDAIQQRLLNSDIRAFDDYIGSHWKGFQYEFDESGRPVAIVAEYEADHPSRKGKKILKQQSIPVDATDKGSVAQAINIIKRFNYTDKDQIFAQPMEKTPSAPKGRGRFDIPKK